MRVPPPTWCWECRLVRRIIYRNEHILYRRKDSRTGEMIFSTIPEEAPVKVYERDYWWSDNWNPMNYGRAIDWDRPFLEQLIELSREVPWFSRSVVNLVNSDYVANCSDLKNCYLIFNSNRNEDCAYGVAVHQSKDCFDNYELDLSELCCQCFMVKNSYEVVSKPLILLQLFDCGYGCGSPPRRPLVSWTASSSCLASLEIRQFRNETGFRDDLYRTFFSSHCQHCQDIYFSKNLANCQNCFACCNLRNKKYHIFNKPYSKDDYFKKLGNLISVLMKTKKKFNKKQKIFG